jgi:hypothetical protein
VARHRALCEVWDHGDRLGRSKYGTCTHHRQDTRDYRLSKSHREIPQSMTVTSDTNCPIADVPAPPAVTVTTPALVTVPANEPAVPAV